MADNRLHENTRNTTRAPTATVSSHRVAAGRTSAHSGGSNVGRFARLHLEVEDALRSPRAPGVESQAPSRSHAQTDGSAMRQAEWAVVAGAAKARLCQRLMDTAAGGRGDSQAFRRKVRSVRRMACAASDGLELPETRTPSEGAQRTGHCRLAQERLAAYKKKPKKAVKPLFSSMKAALCSSRRSAVPGVSEARRRSTIAGTDVIDCRLSRRLASRRNVGDWGCTSNCSTIISRPTKRSHSWPLCWATFHGESFWCGIAGWCIGRPPVGCRNVLRFGYTSNGCQPTLQNLTPSSKSGTGASTPTWPILFRRMWFIWRPSFAGRCDILDLRNVCSVRSSNTLNFQYEMFVYLFKDQ